MLGLACLAAALLIRPSNVARSLSPNSAKLTTAQRRSPTLGSGAAPILANYGRLPLSFESNQGQADPQVKFLSRGLGYELFLTGDEAVLALSGPQTESHRDATVHAAIASSHFSKRRLPQRAVSVLRVKLAGSNPNPRIEGADPLPGKANYFIGKDPNKWVTGISTFSRVRYHEVYPGIDLVYHGSGQGRLEYDFVVAPGADPERIRLGFTGADRVSVGHGGDLRVRVGGAELVENTPLVYQQVGGSQHQLRGSWVMRGRSRVGFAVARYDRTVPLVIDPVLSYSTYLGGNSADGGTGIAVDVSGNAYVTGATSSANFPTRAGAFQPAPAGGAIYNAFVTKLNPTGSASIYSAYLGGDSGGSSIAVDASVNAYVTGVTSDTNFPTTAGAFQTALTGFEDAFITKLNPSGSALVYSTYLGGGGEYGGGIAIDAGGNAYVTGSTDSTNFPITAGAFQATNGGLFNAFIAKLNSPGSALVYSTYLGGSTGTFAGVIPGGGSTIAVDAGGNAYVTGATFDTNFPTTVGAFQTTPAGAFVTKLNPSGSALAYSTYLGGGGDQGYSIAVDASGDAYVTGFTGSADFPTTAGAFQASLAGPQNAFVTKLNPSGSALIYSTYLGGSGIFCPGSEGLEAGGDLGVGIAVDASGNAYVTGGTPSTNFPTTPDAFQTALAGGGCGFGDAFVTKLNPSGSALVYSTYLGSDGGGSGIAVDASGNAYVTGDTSSTDFPATVGAFQTAFGGGTLDAFVAKIDFSATTGPPLVPTPTPTPIPVPIGPPPIPAPPVLPTPVAAVAPRSLSFSAHAIGGVSAAQKVTVTNTSKTAVQVYGVTSSSEAFGETDNCVGTIAAHKSCTINVVFSPTGVGKQTAMLTVADDVGNPIQHPQTVALAGVGTAEEQEVLALPGALSFASEKMGTTSGAQAVTLANRQGVPLKIAGITTGGPFKATSSCGSRLAAHWSCTIAVAFAPAKSGEQSGVLTITNDATAKPLKVALSGSAPAPTPTLTPKATPTPRGK